MFRKFLLLVGMLMSLTAAASPKPAKTITFDNKNVIVLRGEVNGDSVAKVASALLQSPEKEVYLYITSPGGSVFDGMQLVDVIRQSGKRVKCVASFAASMAFGLLQACQDRYVMDHSIVMQHVMSYGNRGQEPNNYSFSNFIRALSLDMDQIQADRVGLSLAEFRSKTRDDWWLTGQAAVKENVADAMVSATCTPELSKKLVKEEIAGFFQTFTVEWSGCPLIESPISVKVTGFGPPTSESQREYAEFTRGLNMRTVFMEMMSKTRGFDANVRH